MGPMHSVNSVPHQTTNPLITYRDSQRTYLLKEDDLKSLVPFPRTTSDVLHLVRIVHGSVKEVERKKEMYQRRQKKKESNKKERAVAAVRCKQKRMGDLVSSLPHLTARQGRWGSALTKALRNAHGSGPETMGSFHCGNKYVDYLDGKIELGDFINTVEEMVWFCSNTFVGGLSPYDYSDLNESTLAKLDEALAQWVSRRPSHMNPMMTEQATSKPPPSLLPSIRAASLQFLFRRHILRGFFEEVPVIPPWLETETAISNIWEETKGSVLTEVIAAASTYVETDRLKLGALSKVKGSPLFELTSGLAEQLGRSEELKSRLDAAEQKAGTGIWWKMCKCGDITENGCGFCGRCCYREFCAHFYGPLNESWCRLVKEVDRARG